MTDEQALGVLGAGFGIVMLVALVLVVLSIVAYWKIFTKAGEPGWKSIIPFYNSFMIYKLVWDVQWFWITLAIAIANIFIPFAVVKFILNIVTTVIGIILVHKLSKAFGHGVGFTLGLIFLSIIFLLILAFDSSEYIGNDGDKIEELV